MYSLSKQSLLASADPFPLRVLNAVLPWFVLILAVAGLGLFRTGVAFPPKGE